MTGRVLPKESSTCDEHSGLATASSCGGVSSGDGDNIGRGGRESGGGGSEHAAWSVSWSVRRAIELLDAAIDRMGSQLIKASDVPMDWSDRVVADQTKRSPTRGSRARVSALSSAFEVGGYGPRDPAGPELT